MIKEIKTVIDKEKLIKEKSKNEFTKPWIRKILLIGIGLGVVQQITGVNSIMHNRVNTRDLLYNT